MNCFFHPQAAAVGTCARCHKGVCADCGREAGMLSKVIFCEDHRSSARAVALWAVVFAVFLGALVLWRSTRTSHLSPEIQQIIDR